MVKTTVKLPREVWMAARVRALEEGSEFQALVAKALQAYLRESKKEGAK